MPLSADVHGGDKICLQKRFWEDVYTVDLWMRLKIG